MVKHSVGQNINSTEIVTSKRSKQVALKIARKSAPMTIRPKRVLSVRERIRRKSPPTQTIKSVKKARKWAKIQQRIAKQVKIAIRKTKFDEKKKRQLLSKHLLDEIKARERMDLLRDLIEDMEQTKIRVHQQFIQKGSLYPEQLEQDINECDDEVSKIKIELRQTYQTVRQFRGKRYQLDSQGSDGDSYHVSSDSDSEQSVESTQGRVIFLQRPFLMNRTRQPMTLMVPKSSQVKIKFFEESE